MKPRPGTDVELAHPWFVGEGIFAAAQGESTQYLDILDLLPADAKEARAAVTYAREGEAVTLKGASLVFEHTEDFTTEAPLAPVVAWSGPKGKLGEMVWQADGEIRRVPAVLLGIRRDLSALIRDRKVPVSALTGAFAAGVVMTLMVGWIF